MLGVGINTGHAGEDFPGELRDLATSVRIEKGAAPDRTAILVAVMEALDRWRVSLAGGAHAAVEEAIFAAITKENARMQYFISYLSVIGVCTPMIGLLGTVFGMKSAFRTLNVSGIGDPGKLSGAIGEVLICTAFGLLIAIPAFFSFYWLRNRAAKLIHNVQETISSLYRKMPYEYLAGAHIGDDELFAALPNWVQQAQPEATQA